MAEFTEKELQLLSEFENDLLPTAWKIEFKYDKYATPFIKFAKKNEFDTKPKIYKKLSRKWHAYNSNLHYFYDEAVSVLQLLSDFNFEIKSKQQFEKDQEWER